MKATILSAAFIALSGTILNAQWTEMAPMSSTRAGHTAATLDDGSILVAGGWNYTTNVLTAEIYDVGSNAWRNVPNMSSQHYNGQSVTLDDGNVLVISGFNGTFNTEECDLFDAATETWSSGGILSQGRSFFTATKLPNGSVLVVGGFDGTDNLASCEIYDPSTNTWSAAGSIATARSYHTANLLSNGKVLITGGFNPDAGYQMSSTEIYDPSTNLWIAGPSMTTGRDFHASSELNDGRILVSGGRFFNGSVNFAYNGIEETEIYDPTTNQWSFFSFFPQGISYHKQITLTNGNVLLIAGVDSSNFSSSGGFTTSESSSYEYDFQTSSWGSRPMIQDARYEFTATAMSNSSVLVTGGVDQSVELFGSVTTLSQMKSEGLTSFIYPNPGNGLINVQFSREFKLESAQLTNLIGQVELIRIDFNATNKVIFNVNGLSKGSYLLSLQAKDGQVVNHKLIIN